jgi:dihydroorotate dehydrogenase electron transfer subunit
MREPLVATVVSTTPLGAYAIVRIAGDGLEPGAPGQFAMVLDPAGPGYLPRPVGLFRLASGDVAMLVDPAHRVGGLAAARALQVLGPLGNGFDLAGADAASTLLVAGGIGITVFPGVPAALGGRPRLVAGFRHAEQAAATTLVAAAAEVALAPDSVLDLVDLEGVRLVLASGPSGLVRAVAERCLQAGVACQVALEAPMGCGFGACYGCAIELDGASKRLCLEGPVVDARRLLAGAT